MPVTEISIILPRPLLFFTHSFFFFVVDPSPTYKSRVVCSSPPRAHSWIDDIVSRARTRMLHQLPEYKLPRQATCEKILRGASVSFDSLMKQCVKEIERRRPRSLAALALLGHSLFYCKENNWGEIHTICCCDSTVFDTLTVERVLWRHSFYIKTRYRAFLYWSLCNMLEFSPQCKSRWMGTAHASTTAPAATRSPCLAAESSRVLLKHLKRSTGGEESIDVLRLIQLSVESWHPRDIEKLFAIMAKWPTLHPSSAFSFLFICFKLKAHVPLSMVRVLCSDWDHAFPTDICRKDMVRYMLPLVCKYITDSHVSTWIDTQGLWEENLNGASLKDLHTRQQKQAENVLKTCVRMFAEQPSAACNAKVTGGDKQKQGKKKSLKKKKRQRRSRRRRLLAKRGDQTSCVDGGDNTRADDVPNDAPNDTAAQDTAAQDSPNDVQNDAHNDTAAQDTAAQDSPNDVQNDAHNDTVAPNAATQAAQNDCALSHQGVVAPLPLEVRETEKVRVVPAQWEEACRHRSCEWVVELHIPAYTRMNRLLCGYHVPFGLVC